MIWTPLCELLGCKHPIIQAGMGPFSTNDLCVASSNAGIVGLVSTSGLFAASFYGKSGQKYLYGKLAEWVGADESIKPGELLKEIFYRVLRETKGTGGTFGANVMVSAELKKPAEEFIRTIVDVRKEDNDMEKRLRLLVTSAGDPLPWKNLVKPSGISWFHVIPFVSAAKRAERAGVDGIIASGHEGGFHVAWDPVHSIVLIPAVVEACPETPVVSTGGFCDGKTLAAALALGTIGMQMGTRLIATKESDFPQLWKEMILRTGDRGTIVTRAFVGPGRFMKSPQSLKLAELTVKHSPKLYIGSADDIFQVSPEILKTEIDGIISAFTGKEETALTAAGECVQRISDMPTVKELIDEVISEAEDILKSLPEKYLR
jgi:enoyl-[acyl-carrier protein] reductase II